MATTSRRKPTAAQLADLKAAKRRGLFTGSISDIQKNGITSHGRKLAKQYKGLSEGLFGVVKIDKAAAAKYKKDGLLVKGDKLLVPKIAKTDTITFSKKTGTVKKWSKTSSGARVEIAVTRGELRALKPNEHYEVRMKNKYGVTTAGFETQASMQEFANWYPSDTDHYSVEITIVEGTYNAPPKIAKAATKAARRGKARSRKAKGHNPH